MFASTIYAGGLGDDGWRAITDGSGFDSRPAWSADGATIEFSSDRDGDERRYVVDAAGLVRFLAACT